MTIHKGEKMKLNSITLKGFTSEPPENYEWKAGDQILALLYFPQDNFYWFECFIYCNAYKKFISFATGDDDLINNSSVQIVFWTTVPPAKLVLEAENSDVSVEAPPPIRQTIVRPSHIDNRKGEPNDRRISRRNRVVR